ncbi:MAG: hypothetical protein MJZ51_04470 [Bacteroidales bacterium]|nr:hypothetical protein [Bacteroidales bacterium]
MQVCKHASFSHHDPSNYLDYGLLHEVNHKPLHENKPLKAILLHHGRLPVAQPFQAVPASPIHRRHRGTQRFHALAPSLLLKPQAQQLLQAMAPRIRPHHAELKVAAAHPPGSISRQVRQVLLRHPQRVIQYAHARQPSARKGAQRVMRLSQAAGQHLHRISPQQVGTFQYGEYLLLEQQQLIQVGQIQPSKDKR